MNQVKEALKKNTMVIALIIVAIFFTFMTDGALLLSSNITNLIAQNGYVVILAVGMLLCILTGGNIDLSVGSIVCLVGAVVGKLMVNGGVNMWVAIGAGLLVGLGIGVWQAFWIAYVRIPPFIVTLAGMLLWRGVALLVLDGLTISPMPDEYIALFNNYVPGYGTALAAGILISVGYIASGNELKQRKTDISRAIFTAISQDVSSLPQWLCLSASNCTATKVCRQSSFFLP